MYRYKAMKVKGKRIDEHRLKMQHYLGRQLKVGEIIHHIDGNGRNNSISNLRIMTRGEHVKLHFPDFGKEPIETKRRNALKNNTWTRKLTGRVLEMLESNLSHRAIAKKLGTSRHTIDRIKTGLHWSLLPEPI